MSVVVHVPSPLASYVGGAASVQVEGATLRDVLAALDRAHPGIRFRMIDEQDRVRAHIRFFVQRELVTTIDAPVPKNGEVHIMAALSGG